MQWTDVINAPYLKDLPFKIELNKLGQILMSPASNQQGRLQYDMGKRIENALNNHPHLGGGNIIMECSIDTPDGVKVADVAWASRAFMEKYGTPTPFPKAPEICVEILSPSNTTSEMQDKVQLYLAKGALEVWLVANDSTVSYFSYEGELAHSAFTV